MITVSLWMATLAVPTCQPLDAAVILSRSDAVIAANEDFPDRLASIRSYWRSACMRDRERASRRVVVSLSRLLNYRRSRLAAASMLIDVGPSLIYARRELGPALRNQRLVEARHLRQTFPILPEDYHVTYDALRCLSTKLNTGRIDRKLCWSVASENQVMDDYLRSTHE
jgi:hypothetical protein